MRRPSFAVGALAVVLIAPSLHAQTAPDISGRWLLASSAPADTHALGTEFSVTQTANTLTLDVMGMSGRLSTSIGAEFNPVPVRLTFTLDGAEHPSQRSAVPPAPSAASASAMVMWSTTDESRTKATWAGRQLVIMTYNTLRVTVPNRTPAISLVRQTVRQTFSLDADGALVVESLIVADPLPWAGEPRSPVPVRSVYTRR